MSFKIGDEVIVARLYADRVDGPGTIVRPYEKIRAGYFMVITREGLRIEIEVERLRHACSPAGGDVT